MPPNDIEAPSYLAAYAHIVVAEGNSPAAQAFAPYLALWTALRWPWIFLRYLDTRDAVGAPPS